MRTQVVFAALCGSALGLARPPVFSETINPTCPRDNCLRAVIASAAFPSPSSAAVDCSSFFLKTITPATVTNTVYASATATEAAVTLTNTNLFSTTSVETAAATSTLFSTEIFGATTTSTTYVTLAPVVSPVPRDLELVARQVTASSSLVPKYASACSGTVRYSSACSCIGVTPRFTTVAAPTTVVTITNTISTTPTTIAQVSTTATIDVTTTSVATSVSYASTTTTDVIVSTVTCSAIPTSFWLVAQGAGVDGQFVVTTGTQNEIIDTSSFSTNIGEATQFFISGGNLWQNIYEANTDNTNIGTIFFDIPGSYGDVVYLTCSTAADLAGPLTCSGYNGNSIFQLCPDGITCAGSVEEPCGGVSLGNVVDPRCQAILFTAVPACNPVVGG